MFVFKHPTTTLLVCQDAGSTRQLIKTMSKHGKVEICAGLTEASQRIMRLSQGREAYIPILEAMDRDRLPTTAGGERLLRVCSNAGSEEHPAFPCEVSVAVVVASTLNSKLRAGLTRLSTTGVRCIFITSEAIRSNVISELLNTQLISALLFLEDSRTFEKLSLIALTLRSDFEATRWNRIAGVLNNGSTAFLGDDVVRKFVDTEAQKIRADQIFISLDPAGFLMRGAKKTKFLMIFDSDARQAINEIAAMDGGGRQLTVQYRNRRPAPGFAEEALPSNRLGRIERLGPKSKWYASRINVSGPPHSFLRNFNW